jgi:hypothetical protein
LDPARPADSLSRSAGPAALTPDQHPANSPHNRENPLLTITRIELANHVEAAFAHGPATRDNLLAYAVGSHARPEVITVIENLPDKPYSTIRDLWYDLPDLPVNA